MSLVGHEENDKSIFLGKPLTLNGRFRGIEEKKKLSINPEITYVSDRALLTALCKIDCCKDLGFSKA